MSGLTLERLLFDPSDVASGPVVGSYLLGTGGEVLSSTSNALNVHIENASIAISATDLDIRDLAYATDSVTAHQGGTWAVTTDVTPNIVPLSSAVSVTDTEVALPTAPLTGRKRLMVQNIGADPIYIGKTGVLVSTGIKVEKGATLSLEAGASAVYFGIAPTGKTVAVRLLES